MLYVDEVADLPDGSHRLSAAGATYNENVIFQGNNRLPLLGVERIGQDGIEILAAAGKLVLDEVLIVGFLVRPGVRHRRMETLESFFFGRFLQFLAA